MAPEPPSKQPTVEEQVLAEYEQKWAQVQRLAKSKSQSRATEFVRAKKQEIISDLAKKYGISRQDVKAIIP